jgi:hypothetical protein
MPNVKKRISWHLTDLLGRDVTVCNDVVSWLKPTPSELKDRRINKRLMARYAAAKMILAAVEDGNSGLFTHILDRTEGKVADKLITVDLNDMVRQLEAGRERLLQARQPQQLVVGNIEGEIVTDSTALTALDSKTSK